MADTCGDVVALEKRGLRIASIFIILVASLLGATLPVVAARQSKLHVPKFTFFICKFVGTGVIIATAWMHLLQPAAEALGDPCLTPRLGDYPWAFFIGLMTVLLMFLIELLVARAEDASGLGEMPTDPALDKVYQKRSDGSDGNEDGTYVSSNSKSVPGPSDDLSYPPGGKDHLAHGKEHKEGDSHNTLGGQLTAIFILEFGIIFHSVFIGLTLGTTDDVVILLIVLIFHQSFEGLGLGSRLALCPWPKGKQWVPYVLAVGFSLSTPLGIAIGIGARPKNGSDQLLTNGIFDAIAAGILMYTGLVELLAHEFMFNPHMRRAPLKIQLLGCACIAFGAGVMATLANWA